jgi:hypothetical protein
LLVGGIIDRRVEVVLEKRGMRIGPGGRDLYRLLVRLVPDLLEAEDVCVRGRDGLYDERAAFRLERDEGASQGDIECVDADGPEGFAASVVAAAAQ